MKINKNHRLSGTDVYNHECPKNKTKFKPGALVGQVTHYSASSNTNGTIKYLCLDSVKASAHLVIGRDGSVHQLVPFDTVAWHAGRSKYDGLKGWNRRSIGTELINRGKLTMKDGKYYDWIGTLVPEDEVFKDGDAYWHDYTDVQILAYFVVSKLIQEKYGLKYAVRHSDIAPSRKIDPGPAFPFNVYKQLINEIT